MAGTAWGVTGYHKRGIDATPLLSIFLGVFRCLELNATNSAGFSWFFTVTQNHPRLDCSGLG